MHKKPILRVGKQNVIHSRLKDWKN